MQTPAPDGRPPASGPAGRRPAGILRLGQIAGVDVLVRASWLLMALLLAVLVGPDIGREYDLGSLGYVAGVVFAVLLYLSVLLHEMSHAVAAKAFDLPVRSVTLHFLGGVTEIEGEPQTPSREFLISVVGPLTSLLVGLAAFAAGQVTPQDTLVRLMLDALAWSNAVVGVLNLVPGLPLDGGRVLRAAVWWGTGRPQLATAVAGWAGRVVAVLAVASPFLLQALTGFEPSTVDFVLATVIGLFLWQGAGQALAAARVRSMLPGLRARGLARRAVAVPSDLPLAEGLRRAHEAQAGAMVVVTRDGRPAALVSEAAVKATPEERRPWVSCGAVARDLEPGLMLDADIDGEHLLRALQTHPAGEYLLLERSGDVYGVLSFADVETALSRA